VTFRCRRPLASPSSSPLTFCIAHFNAPAFLDASLHSIRRFHPEAQVIVADASSAWPEFLAARTACDRRGATLHPLVGRHRHTGLLNYMFNRVTSPYGVFLDQDCLLLERLDPLVRTLQDGKALAGPRDEMRLTNPRLCRTLPELANFRFRSRSDFVHASLMALNVPRVRAWSREPFVWRTEWGPHPLERYYGLTELVRRNQSDGVLTLDSAHTGYGLGQAYLFGGRVLAYHHWYSGQVYGRRDKLDDLFDAGWLRAEMDRFLNDYWKDTLKLEITDPK
jgi:hypothetical protein